MEEKYFEDIPEWSSKLPRFIVQADKVSGRIPVARIDSWKRFADLLEDDFFNQHGLQFVYRGHRRHAPAVSRQPSHHRCRGGPPA